MNLFHRHDWLVFTGSGLDKATNLRICKDPNCNRHETRMYDITRQESVWVEGNFFENIQSPIFIVAETVEAYREAIQQISTEEEKSIPVMWVKDAADLDNMRRQKHPRFFLASDWKDTVLSDSDEFRILMMTRHF